MVTSGQLERCCSAGMEKPPRDPARDSITYSKDQFFKDATAGTLPNATFIGPEYTTISEFIGTSNDYQPHGNIEAGESYVAQVHDATAKSHSGS
jgi:hypothetical protein